MYSRLYSSMMSWYRRWYGEELYLNIVVAVGLTALMYLNILSVILLLAIFGIKGPFEIITDNGRPTFALLMTLSLLHLCFVLWKSSRNGQRDAKSPASKTLALGYMAVSTVIFFGSGIGYALMRH